jgi:hypothetical protein
VPVKTATARQWHSKHVYMATTQDLWEAVFTTLSVPRLHEEGQGEWLAMRTEAVRNSYQAMTSEGVAE